MNFVSWDFDGALDDDALRNAFAARMARSLSADSVSGIMRAAPHPFAVLRLEVFPGVFPSRDEALEHLRTAATPRGPAVAARFLRDGPRPPSDAPHAPAPFERLFTDGTFGRDAPMRRMESRLASLVRRARDLVDNLAAAAARPVDEGSRVRCPGCRALVPLERVRVSRWRDPALGAVYTLPSGDLAERLRRRALPRCPICRGEIATARQARRASTLAARLHKVWREVLSVRAEMEARAAVVVGQDALGSGARIRRQAAITDQGPAVGWLVVGGELPRPVDRLDVTDAR